MKKEIIFSPDAGVPPNVPLSQAIKVGNVIYLSSFVAADPKTRKIVGRTIEEQTRRSIKNCESVLRAAGSSLNDVVRVMVLLKNPRHFERMNREYAKLFPKDPPARTVVKIGAHLPNALISIMMTAVVSGSGPETILDQ